MKYDIITINSALVHHLTGKKLLGLDVLLEKKDL